MITCSLYRRISGLISQLILQSTDLAKEVNEITKGKGAPVVILTANAPELLQTCLDIVKPGGTILQFFNMRAHPTYDSWELYLKEVKLIATRSSVPSDFRTAIDLAVLKKVPLERLITGRYDFEDLVEAIDSNEDRKQNLKVVIMV